MDIALPYENVSLVRPIRATKTDYRFFAILVFLSFFELPIYWLKQSPNGLADAIGIYDLYLPLTVLYLLFRTRGLTMRMPWAWRSYFLVFFAYLVYLFFELLYLTNFRSIAILLKFAEVMLAMAILYTLFTQFDFDVRRVIHIVEVNLAILCLFQLFSFADNLHPIGPIRPGLGVGLWYRLSMPFMAGVSPNPAGFVAGVFILFNLYVRKHRLIERRTFLFVTTLLFLCLAATVSRTNLLVTIFILVVYLLRRSFTRTRYIIAIGVFVAVVWFLINYFADRVSQDSPFWLFLKLVQHPSDFLSRVSGDESFSLRYAKAWPDEIQAWLSSGFSFFFGRGVAFYGIADGTYTGVLANQGVIGLGFFIYIWYIHFYSVWKSKLPYLWILFLYVLINGTTFDTLVTSYRSVQPYLIAIFVMLFAFGGLREQALGERGLEPNGNGQGSQ